MLHIIYNGNVFIIFVEDHAIFNYRLSRARRVVENAFGILAARCRLFRRPIIAQQGRAITYTKTALVLHNYLRTTESNVYCPPGYIDGEDGSGNRIDGGWRRDEDTITGMESLLQTGSNRLDSFPIHSSFHLTQIIYIPI